MLCSLCKSGCTIEVKRYCHSGSVGSQLISDTVVHAKGYVIYILF